MKAVLITAPGGPEVLKVGEVPDPQPSAEEVLVKVYATALNRADLLQRMGRYPAPDGTRSDIPGLEYAGEVMSTGHRVHDFKVGDRVMGLLAGAGYAEKVVTHERLAMPIPSNLTFEEAAAIPEAFLTAYDALFTRLKLTLGESILIHAIGSGVGTAALQLAKSAGAKVFGTAGSSEKLEQAKELGLDFGIPYRTQDFEQSLKELTADRGVDAILDFVGAAYWRKNVACLTPKGRLVLVGLLGGAEAEVDLDVLLRKRLHIQGTVLRGRTLEEKIALTKSFQEKALPLLQARTIKAVVDRTFPLERVVEAHRYMENNQNFGKIVLRM